MSRLVKFIIGVNLLVLAALVFLYPQFMVSPGSLIPEHAELQSDCFACHTPFTGTSAQKCMVCHKPEDIGRKTTAGQTIVKALSPVPFHQKLTNKNCQACHSDHEGVQRFHRTTKFDHGLLAKQDRDQCQSCHVSPKDSLHSNISGNCSQCHAQQQWKPATFDHKKYFVLDRDHNVRCTTCHVQSDYKRYTCYGCHEHSEAKIRRQHAEEGIRDFTNCVKCHRSADAD